MVLATQSCREFLEWELTRRTRANPRYSVRAFAQHLGLGAGELSEILRGKRRLSLKAAAKAAASLGLNEHEMKHLFELVTLEKLRASGHNVAAVEKDADSPASLTAELFTLVSDWYCLAILNLKDTHRFRWDTKWIASRLGISEIEVRSAIDRLVRVGMLEKKGKTYSQPKDFHIDPRGIPSEAVRSFHRQMLEKASQAIELQQQADREVTGLTLACDKAALPAMKKELTSFLKSFNSRFGKGKKLDAVYQLELALFQLTQQEQK
jgi:uncharacterized protein (TIGR02147 family)